MSTDSTDLTFVRCPACRSLVPAVSSRCRMCGAGLDSNASAVKDEPRTSRVRQRTMSQPGNELSAAAQSARGEADDIAQHPSEERSATPIAEPTPPHTIPMPMADVDPLNSYVEEVSEDDAVGSHLEEEPSTSSKSDPHVLDAVPPAEPVVSAISEPASQPASEPPPRPQASKQERKGNLVFKGDKSEPPPSPSQEESRREKEEPRREKQPSRDEGRKQPHDRDRRQDPSSSRAPAQSVPKRDENRSAAVEGDLPGRLIGWMVSYAHPDGTAYELREGRFFIVRERLRESDMVLDEAGISTPHALMKVSAKRGVYIQDLMSETGVFVRRSGSENYQQEDEPCKLNHGDWLRIGAIEFVVSLVAHVGEG